MLKLKIFIAAVVIAVADCEIQIPEKYKAAKPISEHPRYQNHQSKKNFAKAINSKVEINSSKIGGQSAVRGQFPHHALIYIDFLEYGEFQCSGSIIHQNWILTSAYCVYDDFEFIDIYLGIVDDNGPYSWSTTVNDVIIHPEYDEPVLRNNIAMIKIDPPEDLFFGLTVAPIALPTEYVDLADQTGTVIGFEILSDNYTGLTETLLFNSLKAINNEECDSIYEYVHETNLCAVTNSKASDCITDSGSSYIFNINGFKTLEGILSFSPGSDCRLGYPVGFTRVSPYLNWIYYNINRKTTPPPETEETGFIEKIWKNIFGFFKSIFG